MTEKNPQANDPFTPLAAQRTVYNKRSEELLPILRASLEPLNLWFISTPHGWTFNTNNGARSFDAPVSIAPEEKALFDTFVQFFKNVMVSARSTQYLFQEKVVFQFEPINGIVSIGMGESSEEALFDAFRNLVRYHTAEVIHNRDRFRSS